MAAGRASGARIALSILPPSRAKPYWSMKSPKLFQRLLRIRAISFSTALALHLGWALALSVLLIAARRGLAEGKAPVGALGAAPLVGFALVCAAASAAVWGRRRQTVRWI